MIQDIAPYRFDNQFRNEAPHADSFVISINDGKVLLSEEKTEIFPKFGQIEDIINDQLYCKPEESLWICLGCGNILSGLCAPEICPVCGVDGGFYDHLSTYN